MSQKGFTCPCHGLDVMPEWHRRMEAWTVQYWQGWIGSPSRPAVYSCVLTNHVSPAVIWDVQVLDSWTMQNTVSGQASNMGATERWEAGTCTTGRYIGLSRTFFRVDVQGGQMKLSEWTSWVCQGSMYAARDMGRRNQWLGGPISSLLRQHCFTLGYTVILAIWCGVMLSYCPILSHCQHSRSHYTFMSATFFHSHSNLLSIILLASFNLLIQVYFISA